MRKAQKKHIDCSDNTIYRTETIHFKLSPEEKHQIEINAETFGGNISEFARNQLLHPDNDSGGKLVQQIVCELCRHASLTEQIKEPTLHEKFARWEENFWLLIK